MAKNKRRPGGAGGGVSRAGGGGGVNNNNPMADDIKQAEAAARLTQMIVTLAMPPEPVLNLFRRLEIPWSIDELPQELDGDPIGQKYLVVKLEDLEAGEQRNQQQGSLLNRMYGGVQQ
jgi:hypothetical protein